MGSSRLSATTRSSWRSPPRRPWRGRRSWLRRSTICRASTRPPRPDSSTGDEHHQAEPEDRRHRGLDLQGEAEDQEVFRRAGRHLRRHDRQLLKTLSAKSDKIVSSGYDALKRPCLNHINVKLFLNPYLECNSMGTLNKRKLTLLNQLYQIAQIYGNLIGNKQLKWMEKKS